MATPSRSRNFFGGLVDRVLPGSNYNRQTGQYSNIGRGIAGRVASTAAGLLGGPLAGAAVNRAAGALIDGTSPFSFGGNKPGQVVPQSLGAAPGLQIDNLGFGSPVQMQAPTLPPAASFQNAGFGNYSLAGAMPAQPMPWQPQSDWGAQIAQPAAPAPASPFSPNSEAAQAAAASMSRPSTPIQGADSASNQASLFLGNMDRMSALARNAMNKNKQRS